jgi:O-antigen/teichoic acid export membrane protein
MSQRESRVKKTLLNARVNFIFYFLTLALSFFSRRIFLDCLGTDFVGLTGTLQNLLGFLNLAELGIGGAIGYLLYKPIFDQDQDQINEIISVMGYLYRWIGGIICGAGCLLACFLPLIFPESGFDLALIYAAYFAFLGSSLIGYFINYRQNLLGADQRNYVVTAYFQTATIIKTIIQLGCAYYTRNLYLWVLIEFMFGVIYSIILNWKINQTYPWLKADVALGRKVFKKYPEVMTKTKQLFYHRIGGFFQFQMSPFLIYTYGSLTMVALYQNYTLITSKISGFFGNLLGGMGASIGNLIAEGNKGKIVATFWELFSLQFFIAGLICAPVYLLIDPFIVVWLGDKYLLGSSTLILILITTFIQCTRPVVDDFIYGFGLFWDVWSPLVESALLLIFGISFGAYLGINGVLLGPLSALIFVISLWKPFMLFKWGFKNPIYIYWVGYIKNLCCVLTPLLVTTYITNYININPSVDFFNWTIYSIIITCVYGILSYLAFLMFTDGMKLFNKRIYAQITNSQLFKIWQFRK